MRTTPDASHTCALTALYLGQRALLFTPVNLTLLSLLSHPSSSSLSSWSSTLTSDCSFVPSKLPGLPPFVLSLARTAPSPSQVVLVTNHGRRFVSSRHRPHLGSPFLLFSPLVSSPHLRVVAGVVQSTGDGEVLHAWRESAGLRPT
ncbi:hypothetical protein OE88DRAFT_1659612 [Heliocybe sulcata]|uniref:Uncharacterized protein n=1 Tax=Heliocybe sulcata TaxID=5364 RepID=A0A5C3N269_9AGAM|nr:hypothetical protein OE88DRAFT_1659612 [Heliocybe sulcata]